MQIVDLGSGSCLWNRDKLPVVGVDISEKLLKFGADLGYIKKSILHDIENKALPFEDKTFDIVVISEVLEHVKQPARLLKEINRTTKNCSYLIITVPYDTGLSPWRCLFTAQCFLKGTILGDNYYKNNCGHIQHFSPEALSELCNVNGFKIKNKRLTFLNIAFLLEKQL